MSIQPIRLFGDPVLRTRAEEVVDFDKELRTLVADLGKTMLDAPGAGLARWMSGGSFRSKLRTTRAPSLFDVPTSRSSEAAFRTRSP